MSWLIFLGNLAKIFFLESQAKILQDCTILDIFTVSTLSRSWQDLTRFSMFLIKVYKVSVHWGHLDPGFAISLVYSNLERHFKLLRYPYVQERVISLQLPPPLTMNCENSPVLYRSNKGIRSTSPFLFLNLRDWEPLIRH